MPLLDIHELNCCVGTDKQYSLLNGLSLAIEKGEVHALLGTNGTGKSTLAYLIMGCEGYLLAGGHMRFEGLDISGLRLHERARLGITMAWQEPVRFEGVTVADYLTLRERGADAAPFLELAGLTPAHYLGRMVDKQLSGGERKRVELASLLALRPKLAVLDEPDSGIDMLSTRDIINVIQAFRDGGSAVLLITHREEITVIADRASQLCNGRIVCSGRPENVAEHYKQRHCLTCSGMECHYV